jgi:ornithine carbamoyltransferase
MNHFLDINKTDPTHLRSIIDTAHAMKSARKDRPKGAPDDTQPLKDQMVALIFEKPSTRTRVSFDVGVRQMGGQTMVLSGSEMQLGHGETIADTARVLSRYVDVIMIRTFEEDVLLELAEYATVPVINGLTNRTHPCQIMADVMTFEEHRGPIAGKKVVWCGDGNNVFASFAHAAGQFGFDLTFSGPQTLDPEQVFWTRPARKGPPSRSSATRIAPSRAPISSSPTPGSRCMTASPRGNAVTTSSAPTRWTKRSWPAPSPTRFSCTACPRIGTRRPRTR